MLPPYITRFYRLRMEIKIVNRATKYHVISTKPGNSSKTIIYSRWAKIGDPAGVYFIYVILIFKKLSIFIFIFSVYFFTVFRGGLRKKFAEHIPYLVGTQFVLCKFFPWLCKFFPMVFSNKIYNFYQFSWFLMCMNGSYFWYIIPLGSATASPTPIHS